MTPRTDERAAPDDSDGVASALADARARIALGGPLLVALDFDGTLTEIVDDPDAPTLSHARREVLARIPSAGERWLAIVSGRSLEDTRARVRMGDAILVGSHGLEIEGAGLSLRLAPAGAEGRLTTLLASLPLDHAAIIEDKGATATLHVRPRGDDRKLAALGEAVRGPVEAAGFALRPGKASWEIRPRGVGDKGKAVRRLLDALPGAGPERAIYVGDDRTDEDAFRALPEAVTVRVGPPDVPTAARHRLADPSAVYRFLEGLTAGSAVL